MSLNQTFRDVFNFGGKKIHLDFWIQKELSMAFPKQVLLMGKDHQFKRYMGTAYLQEDGTLKHVTFKKD